jgi:hypothetical protein
VKILKVVSTSFKVNFSLHYRNDSEMIKKSLIKLRSMKKDKQMLGPPTWPANPVQSLPVNCFFSPTNHIGDRKESSQKSASRASFCLLKEAYHYRLDLTRLDSLFVQEKAINRFSPFNPFLSILPSIHSFLCLLKDAKFVFCTLWMPKQKHELSSNHLKVGKICPHFAY